MKLQEAIKHINSVCSEYLNCDECPFYKKSNGCYFKNNGPNEWIKSKKVNRIIQQSLVKIRTYCQDNKCHLSRCPFDSDNGKTISCMFLTDYPCDWKYNEGDKD